MNTETDALEVTEMTARQPQAGEPDRCLRYLTPDEYCMWDALVEVSRQGTVFCRSWWLRATGGRDVRVLGYFRGGRLVAGMPLLFKRRLGFNLCTMPKLTPTWGVVIHPISGKREHTDSREMEILRAFASRLAQERFFFQAFHPTLENWLPFYWTGFKQTSKFTYVLEDLNPDQIWKETSSNTRREVRKARKQGVTVHCCNADTVFEASLRTFARQRLKHPFKKEYFEHLFKTAKAQNAGECLAATDQEGRVHAAAFLVWDKKTTYFLVTGGDPALRSSGAHSLLVWESVRLAAEHSVTFDFEGSVVESVEAFFRSFGARRIPYNQIVKLPIWARVYTDFLGKT
jgi:hypothetical protein